MSKFDSIRPFYDAEANKAIRQIIDDPMMEAMMNFTFPHENPAHWKDLMRHTHSLRDFQINFIYPALMKVLEKKAQMDLPQEDLRYSSQIQPTFIFQITAILFWTPPY